MKMAFPQFVSPKRGREIGKCNWCWTAPARSLWVKVPEVSGKKYRAPVEVPVCLSCENVIRRNYVDKKLTQVRIGVSKEDF